MATEQIKSSRWNTLACLGNFYRAYSKCFPPIEKAVPHSVRERFNTLQEQCLTIPESSAGYPPTVRSSIEAVSYQGVDFPDGTLYVGIFSAGNKLVEGYLVILDPRSELLLMREGFTELLGVFDVNRNMRDEFLAFWGSDFGGGVDVLIPKLKNGELYVQRVHRLDTVWD